MVAILTAVATSTNDFNVFFTNAAEGLNGEQGQFTGFSDFVFGG